jgi:predicted nucleotidyltransferase
MQRESFSPSEEVPTLSGALAILSLHEAELRSAGVSHAAIFGSVARGEATAASDIDVLVELESGRPISLFDLIGIELRLSDIFGRKVDVVSKRGLRSPLDDTIVADAVAAF